MKSSIKKPFSFFALLFISGNSSRLLLGQNTINLPLEIASRTRLSESGTSSVTMYLITYILLFLILFLTAYLVFRHKNGIINIFMGSLDNLWLKISLEPVLPAAGLRLIPSSDVPKKDGPHFKQNNNNKYKSH